MATRRLHFVTGKGGVGKSTVATALALEAAARGHRVLAIELSEAAGLCRILGVTPPGPGAVTEAADGVWLSQFDGAAALAEYLTRKVWLGRLLPAVLEHPIYRAFVAAAPGIRELMAIGKVRDELRRRDLVGHHWDTVVVDGGSSGHALAYLRIAGAAARAFTSGRVHRESSRIDALLRDPDHTAIHLVATAEEMPLAEATAVAATLRDELTMPLGSLYINMTRPPAPAGIGDAIARLPDGELGALARVARGWERIQERGIAGIEAALGLRAVRLPRVWRAADERARARALAGAVGEAAL